MAKKPAPPKPREPKQLEADVRALLGEALDDKTLRTRLEALAAEQAFNGLTYLWGPVLYQRNRVMFRPFILNHFATMLQTSREWKAVRWKDQAATLDAWLEEVDRRDDVELFRRLYPWKHALHEWGGVQEGPWRADLLARFKAAKERHERNQVLSKFEMRAAPLDEATALALYEVDAAAARPFILRHPPNANLWEEKRKLPAKLCDAARQRGDDELYFTLYRKTVPQKTWEKDTQALAGTVADPQQLRDELERRHPDQRWGIDFTGGFFALAKARGRDVTPYLMRHMDSVWDYYGYGPKKENSLLELARQQGWWDVWGILVRKGSPDQYNKEVLELVKNRALPDEVVFRRLTLLSGASSEWNWGRFAFQHIQYLNDKAAVALYERFPELVHGPFRQHLSLQGWQSDGLKTLLSGVLAKDDQPLIDHLAGQAILFGRWYYQAKKDSPARDALLAYFKQVGNEPAAFARRVASVLGRVPAYAIGRSYQAIVESNELARLFLVESETALLHDPRSVRDLLEASEIQAQMLALRVMRQDDDRARQMAAANLDLLQATLVRFLYRKPRVVAFEALANAATTLENARLILRKAKQAFDLPEAGYPREHLLSLMAQLYRRWPELRGGAEWPIVFASKKTLSKWAPA